MASNNKKTSSDFNKAAKGALAGAGIAVLAAALPIIPLSLPVIAVGAAIGAIYKAGK